MPEKFTDALTYVLSVAFAAGVIVFASYKVIKLNGMEDPPPNMGLNFPEPRRKFILDETAVADPIMTQTLAPAVAPEQEPLQQQQQEQQQQQQQQAALTGPVSSYELLAVVDGIAFVEIDLARGKTLVPVSVGTVLPGGLQIESITRQNGRWVLLAGPLRLEQVESLPQ
jgi:hypothetical protein